MKDKIRDKEVHGLIKLSDELVIKGKSTEIGVLKSEIDELKYKLDIAEKSNWRLKNKQKLSKFISAEERMKKAGLTFDDLDSLEENVTILKLLTNLRKLILPTKGNQGQTITKKSLKALIDQFCNVNKIVSLWREVKK